jgi:hypothetical protein
MSLANTAKEKPIASITAVVSFVITVVGGVFLVEDRYAQAQEVDSLQQEVSEMQQTYSQKADMMLKYLQMQSQTDITILEMKEAQQGLTPAETVRLNNLKEQLNHLEGE